MRIFHQSEHQISRFSASGTRDIRGWQDDLLCRCTTIKSGKHARESIRKQLWGTAGSLSRVQRVSFEVIPSKPNYRLDDCGGDRKTSHQVGFQEKKFLLKAFSSS